MSGAQLSAPPPAVAAPEAKETAPKVEERPDRTSAMVTAVAQGSRVEDLSARTPSSAMYANPNGTWTLESHSGLVRSRDGQEKWVPVDTTLVNADEGVSPAAVPFDVEYGDGGTKDLATVTSPTGATLSLDWPAKLPAGTVEGDQVAYEPGSVDNGDLVVTSHPEGFNFSVVLNEAPAGGDDDTATGPEYKFPLTLSEGRFVTRDDGSIDVKSDGKVVASITPPVMWDSSDEPKQVPVTADLEGNGTDRVLVLRPDPTYLAAPERVYPVTVDPTVVLTATGDTWVQNILPNTSQSTSTELRVGTNNLGIGQSRSYLNFDTSALGSPDPSWIADAKVSLSNFTAGSCSGSAIKMSQITSTWTVPGITWGTQPTVTATGAATSDTGHGFTGCTTEGVVDFNATDIVKSWVGGAPNYGVQLAAVTLNNASYRKYRSLENGDTTKSPTLTVTIGRRPDTPTSLAATPGQYNNFITSKTPTLSAVVTDPDGGQVKGYFEIKQGSTLVWSGTSTAVPSGGTTTINVPSGKLNEATTYVISVWGEDDTNSLSSAAATKTVTVDTIAPTATITSAQFTNGTWTTTIPGSDTVTIDGSADTGGFHMNYDGVTNAAGANTAGDRVQTYTPTAGWHVFTATPIDKAGNYGTPVTLTYGTGSAAFTTPSQWTPSTASFPMDFSGPPSATGATLQWRVLGETTWRTAGEVKKSDGSAWSGSVSGTGRSTTGALVWNATDEAYAGGNLSGNALLEARGCFHYAASADSCSNTLYLSLYASAFGDTFPTAELGPAQVALLSGEAMISDTDAADSKAGIGRTFSSLSDDTLSEGVFGPGWSDPLVLASNSDAAASVVDNRSKDGTLVIVDADGGSQTFTPTSGGTYKPLQPTGDATSLSLIVGSPDTLSLSRPLGAGSVVTTWEWKTSDNGTSPGWTLKESDAPGTGNDLSVNSTSRRPTFVRESDPAASSTCNASTQTLGCRGLKLTYTGAGASIRVSKIERVVGAATAGAVSVKPLATYTYASGTLSQACGVDPDGAGAAASLCTEYTYITVAGRTLLATLKPAGLKAWRLAYDSLGRLESVKRERPVSSGGGDATWSIDYSLTPGSSGLPDMTPGKIAEWGQQRVPTKAFAIYQPHTGATSINKAGLVYVANDGAVTNTATYGPNGWVISTRWLDTRGNTVQFLDGVGWTRTQAAPAAARLKVAAEASAYTVYNTWGSGDKVGTRVVDEYGAARTAKLRNGTLGYFRPHSTYMYDDSPNVDPELIADRPSGATPGLIVKTTSSAATVDRTVDYDLNVVKRGYGPIVAGDGSGWDLGQPTSVSSQVDGTSWSTSITRYATNGDVIETRQPGGATDSSGAGTDAHSTFTKYYSASGGGDCGGQPAWAGQVCKSGAAAQPAGTDVPTTFYAAYDSDLNPTSTQLLVSSGVVGTTIADYDELGRMTSSTVATSGTGVATDSIDADYRYDTETGLPIGVITAGEEVVNSYDAWGRQTGYSEPSGNAASTVYDQAGRVSSYDNGEAVTSYSYDDHGALTTASVDNGVGAFDYSYRADGSISTIEYPNGMSARYAVDEVGSSVSTTYYNGAQSLLAFTSITDVAGRVTEQTSTASQQNFNYDLSGRLVNVEDRRASGCITREYQFNASSERTALNEYGPLAGGACQTATPTHATARTYDAAGRLTDPGYAYDPLGRTIAVPAADTTTAGGAAATITYRANDMVDSISQNVAVGGATELRKASYAIDATSRVSDIIYSTNGSETQRLRYRYGNGTDSPVAIDSSSDSGSSWSTTKYVAVPLLGLTAEKTNSGVLFRLANPHGDLVATADSNGILASYVEADEFGRAAVGGDRYGWLGSQQRSSDTVGGFVLMGARLYNPASGRFLSLDPVQDGGSTVYGYPLDPVNGADVDGCRECKKGENWRARDPNWSKDSGHTAWFPAAASMYKWTNKLMDVMDWIVWVPSMSVQVTAARWRYEWHYFRDQACLRGIRWWIYVTDKYQAIQGKVKVSAGVGPLKKTIWHGWVGNPWGDRRVSRSESYRRA